MTGPDLGVALLAVPAATSLVYYIWSALGLRRWSAEPVTLEPTQEPALPVTFFRPLKSGVPDLAGKLELLIRAMQPEDQLLIGVDPNSAEAAQAETIRAAFSATEIAIVRCEPNAALNPKISKLVQMVPLARHEHWILSDSETLLDADFLTAFRREWQTCDVLTAPYRFVGAHTWPQRLDAAAVLLTLWPGLVALRTADRVRMTMGACTGFRRRDLEAVGGWAAFGDHLAEDHQLGVALAAAGRRITISRHPVSLESDPLTWRDYWRHQQRVAITYRVANPRGFGAAFLAQGLSSSFLLICWQPRSLSLWLLFLSVWGVRYLTARAMARRIAFPLVISPLLVLVASLVETTCWLWSWIARRVWWAGHWWRVRPDGKLRRV